MTIKGKVKRYRKGIERDPISKLLLPGPDSEPAIRLRHFSMSFNKSTGKNPQKKQEISWMVECFVAGKWATYMNDIGDTYPTLAEATAQAKEVNSEGIRCRILKCVRRFCIHRVLIK